MSTIFRRIWLFYYEGFKSMTLGKTLWLLIIIKLFIMFFVLKPFFFKNELNKYETDEQKSEAIIHNLTNR